MADFAEDANRRAAVKLFTMGNALGRSFMAPPDVPAERVAALRKAFLVTLSDSVPDLSLLCRTAPE